MAVDFKKLGKKASKGSKASSKASSKSKETSKPKATSGGKFDDSNRFALFPNDKDGNEARPDYTGKVTIVLDRDIAAGEAVELRLAGWLSNSDKIGDYISGRVSEPQDK